MTSIACVKTKRDPKVSMDKWSVLLGFLLSIWGTLIITNPRYYGYVYGRYFDFAAYHIPLGLFIVALGIFFITIGVRKENGNGSQHS